MATDRFCCCCSYYFQGRNLLTSWSLDSNFHRVSKLDVSCFIGKRQFKIIIYSAGPDFFIFPRKFSGRNTYPWRLHLVMVEKFKYDTFFHFEDWGLTEGQLFQLQSRWQQPVLIVAKYMRCISHPKWVISA